MGIYGIIWVFKVRVNTWYFKPKELKFTEKKESKREHFINKEICQINYKPGSVI